MKSKNRDAICHFAPHAVVASMAAGGACGSAAFELDAGNPDIKARWDNTVRYNGGFRMEKQDPRILASPSYDESDAKFHKGQMVTNRLDFLSELDLNYKGMFGARVVASAWHDEAYDLIDVKSPAAGGAIPPR